MISNKIPTAYAYFITIATYGTWLHGDSRESIDLKHNQINKPRIKSNPKLQIEMEKNQKHLAYLMNEQDRIIVMNSIKDTCKYFNWRLYTVHVRTNHLHMLIRSEEQIETVMSKIKRYATRDLNKHSKQPQEKYWARHASTRYVWDEAGHYFVMNYIIEQQGKKMACYHEPWYQPTDEDYFW